MSASLLEIDPMQVRMQALIARMAPLEGYNLTQVPQVRLLRSNRPLQRTPVLYDPGIVIVCQGRKRGYWGEQEFVYDAQHYLAVSVPVPFTMVTDASEQEPLLAIYFHLDFELAGELMLQLDEQHAPPSTPPRGMYASPMDQGLREAVLRLLETLGSPLEAAVMGPSRVREVYFRILLGEQGGSLRAALTGQGRFGNVSRAIRTIHGRYAEALDVTALAREAHLSVPAFHNHFKAVTRTSPMQYLKSIRLHQARLLMLRNDMAVSGAADAVGYESLSQFSREFKRLFGLTPTDEVARMRAAFVLPAPEAGSVFVSSH